MNRKIHNHHKQPPKCVKGTPAQKQSSCRYQCEILKQVNVRHLRYIRSNKIAIGNTRARDFYDLFVLVKIKKDEIRWNVLKEAVLATATKRDSLEELTEYKEIIEDMQESQFLERIWERYKEENTYSEGIAFADTLDIVSWIGRELEKY